MRQIRRILIFRLTSLVVITSLLMTMCGAATTDLSIALGSALRNYARRIHRQYSQTPAPPFLGPNPGRDPGRGVWSPAQLADLDRMNDSYQASMHPLFNSRPPTSVSVMSGSSYPWEGTAPTAAGSLNTSNGNKITEIPLLDWKVRGGSPLAFTLYHSSESNYNGILGENWSWTYDVFVNTGGLTGPVIHWGDGTCVPYTTSGSAYTAPAGIYDQLTSSGGAWKITKKDGTVYNLNSFGYLTSVVDRNGNTITLTLNSNDYCTAITDPTGRSISISYNGSNQISSITDPLSRTWSFTYSSNDLTEITWPAVDGTTYYDQFGYNSANCITSHTDRRGNSWGFSYNSSQELTGETNPLSHSWSYGYTSSQTTITDPLSHASYDNYSSGILASHEDEASFSESYNTRDSNYNVTKLTDKRGNVWNYTWDSKGNMLTKEDPLSHTTTWTYNSGYSEPLTVTDANSNETSMTYDSSGNLLTVTDALSHAQETDTYDSYGELQTRKDALSNTTTLGGGIIIKYPKGPTITYQPK